MACVFAACGGNGSQNSTRADSPVKSTAGTIASTTPGMAPPLDSGKPALREAAIDAFPADDPALFSTVDLCHRIDASQLQGGARFELAPDASQGDQTIAYVYVCRFLADTASVIVNTSAQTDEQNAKTGGPVSGFIDDQHAFCEAVSGTVRDLKSADTHGGAAVLCNDTADDSVTVNIYLGRHWRIQVSTRHAEIESSAVESAAIANAAAVVNALKAANR